MLRKCLIIGGPCKIRTCDQLVKSASVSVQAIAKQALATHAACHTESQKAQKRDNAITVPHVFRHSGRINETLLLRSCFGLISAGIGSCVRSVVRGR
jgi:hypothetical protein